VSLKQPFPFPTYAFRRIISRACFPFLGRGVLVSMMRGLSSTLPEARARASQTQKQPQHGHLSATTKTHASLSDPRPRPWTVQSGAPSTRRGNKASAQPHPHWNTSTHRHRATFGRRALLAPSSGAKARARLALTQDLMLARSTQELLRHVSLRGNEDEFEGDQERGHVSHMETKSSMSAFVASSLGAATASAPSLHNHPSPPPTSLSANIWYAAMSSGVSRSPVHHLPPGVGATSRSVLQGHSVLPNVSPTMVMDSGRRVILTTTSSEAEWQLPVVSPPASPNPYSFMVDSPSNGTAPIHGDSPSRASTLGQPTLSPAGSPLASGAWPAPSDPGAPAQDAMHADAEEATLRRQGRSASPVTSYAEHQPPLRGSPLDKSCDLAQPEFAATTTALRQQQLARILRGSTFAQNATAPQAGKMKRRSKRRPRTSHLVGGIVAPAARERLLQQQRERQRRRRGRRCVGCCREVQLSRTGEVDRGVLLRCVNVVVPPASSPQRNRHHKRRDSPSATAYLDSISPQPGRAPIYTRPASPRRSPSRERPNGRRSGADATAATRQDTRHKPPRDGEGPRGASEEDNGNDGNGVGGSVFFVTATDAAVGTRRVTARHTTPFEDAGAPYNTPVKPVPTMRWRDTVADEGVRVRLRPSGNGNHVRFARVPSLGAGSDDAASRAVASAAHAAHKRAARLRAGGQSPSSSWLPPAVVRVSERLTSELCETVGFEAVHRQATPPPDLAIPKYSYVPLLPPQALSSRDRGFASHDDGLFHLSHSRSSPSAVPVASPLRSVMPPHRGRQTAMPTAGHAKSQPPQPQRPESHTSPTSSPVSGFVPTASSPNRLVVFPSPTAGSRGQLSPPAQGLSMDEALVGEDVGSSPSAREPNGQGVTRQRQSLEAHAHAKHKSRDRSLSPPRRSLSPSRRSPSPSNPHLNNRRRVLHAAPPQLSPMTTSLRPKPRRPVVVRLPTTHGDAPAVVADGGE